jgi:dihydroflavonol-4-reductase
MTRVFLTGGTGLLGGRLLAALRERGDDVVALSRSDAGDATVRAAGARPVHADLLDDAALAHAMDGCELAFHVAGINALCPADPDELERVNVGGAAAVARAAAAAGVRRLVHASSAAAIGEPRGAIGREDTPHRGWYLSAYDRTKHAGERAVLAIAAQRGLDVVCVNPASVQGPGRATGTGALLLAQLDGRLKAFVDTRFSVVDIDDCTRGHLLAAERGAPGERYLLCGATLTSLEALDLLARLSGRDERPRFVPRWIAPPLAGAVERGFRLARREPPVCPAMARTLLHGHAYDGSRATRELGLEYTPVEDTLRRTAAWAHTEGLLRHPLPG